jgi:hypothetical protein
VSVNVLVGQGSRDWANNLNDLRERWSLRHEALVDFVDFGSKEKEQLFKHGTTKIKVMPVVLFSEDLKKISKTKLLELKREILDINDKYQTLLSDAFKGKASQDTYIDLIASKKSTYLHVLSVDTELGRRKEVYRKSLRSIFIDVCMEKLPPDVFKELMDLATSRVYGDD